jgi:hypothetical protein
MSKRALECRIARGSQHQATLEVDADPANPADLRQILVQWLEGNKWDRGRWREFDMTVFAGGTSKRLARVRA